MVWLFLIFSMCILLLLLLRGRTGHPGLAPFRERLFAHRGLYDQTVPENSLQAFSLAFDRGYGIEFDLHLLKDGSLAVLHDSDLTRMTGRKGFLEDLTREELSACRLKGTRQTIPTLSQVLTLCAGRVPLIIELKSFRGNAAQLTQAACKALEGYSGVYCLESFDPRCLLWLKKHRPQLIRGQLAENFLKSKTASLPWPLRFAASFHLQSFLTRPDFIAHRFRDRRTAANYLIRKFWKVQGVTWTVDTDSDLEAARKEGWIPIFETIRP